MPTEITPRARLEHSARRNQHGVILRHQALAVGIPEIQIDRRVRRDQWVLGPGRGTYLLASHADKPESLLFAANIGVDAVAWGQSAVALWGLGGHPEVPIVASRRRIDGTSFDTTRIRDLDDAWLAHRNGIATATLEVGLAAMAPDCTKGEMDELVDVALRSQLTTRDRIVDTFRSFARQGRTGSTLLRTVATERSTETSVPLSAWSRSFSQKLVRSRLPVPELEHRVLDRSGTFVAQVDLAYPQFQLAIELDSVGYHLNRVAFEVDRRRDVDLADCGWRVVRFTWDQYSNDWSWVVERIDAQLRTAA